MNPSVFQMHIALIFRENQLTSSDASSTNVLLKDDEDDASDIAFSHFNHSKGMPPWIAKHFAPAPKHKLSHAHYGSVNEFGRPTWLSRKQRVMLDQVSIYYFARSLLVSCFIIQ